MLELVIRDDGVGGAEPDKGSGLIGLIDRVEAIGGRLTVASPPGSGTTLSVRLPLTPPEAAVSCRVHDRPKRTRARPVQRGESGTRYGRTFRAVEWDGGDGRPAPGQADVSPSLVRGVGPPAAALLRAWRANVQVSSRPAPN